MTHVCGLVEPDVQIHLCNLFQVAGLQIKVGRIQVLSQDFRSRSLGDDGQAALGGPSKEDLGGSLLVLGSNLLDEGMLHQGSGALGTRHIKLHESSGAERRVGCDDDALLLSKVDEVGLLKVGVVLNLQRSRANLGVDEGIVHRLGLVVGDTDASGKLLLYQLLHGTPGLLKGGLAPSNLALAVIEPSWRVTDLGVNILEGSGEVDEEEVKVVNLPVGKLLAGDGLDLVLVVESLPQLGDNEELLALHDTLLNGAGDTLTTLLLVTIIWIGGKY